MNQLKPAFIIIICLCIISMLVDFILRGALDPENIPNYIYYNFYYGLPLSIVNGLYYDKMSVWLPWDKNPKLRAWLGFTGSIIITMATLVLLNYILLVHIQGEKIDALFAPRNRVTYIIALVITILISAILHAIGFFEEIVIEKNKSELLRQEILRSELNALKAHVDPHFLFNSFNALSGLIDEDTDKAQAFLGGLTKIYRHILENRNEQTNTIHNEITFAKNYLSIHQARFENSIFLDVDIKAETANQKIASLSLQLLLENAVKHNSFDEDQPLKINITSNAEYLIISNNTKKRKQLNESNKMGLQNISDRYELLSKKAVQIEDTDEIFIVKIPIL